MEGKEKKRSLCAMKESARKCGCPSEEKCAGCGWSTAEAERRERLMAVLVLNPQTGLMHIEYEEAEDGTGC